MIYVKREQGNPEVTNYYLDIIGSALLEKYEDCQIKYFTSINEQIFSSGDIVVVSYAPDVIKLLKNKGIKIVFWSQGVWPEESYMKHSSKIRYYVTSLIESIALRKANFVFFVSEAMRDYYIKKYNIAFDHYYVMPCLNESIHEDAFFYPGKYENNVFCYAGATVAWQCFEETIALYSKIERINPSSKLLLLVKDRELALKLIKKYEVRSYEIDYVPVEKLKEKLREVKFGFIIRMNDPINIVATPTKNSTYISNGIIPILSSCLVGLQETMYQTNYWIKCTEDENATVCAITDVMNKEINPNDILADYNRIFDTSYNRDLHISNLKRILNL